MSTRRLFAVLVATVIALAVVVALPAARALAGKGRLASRLAPLPESSAGWSHAPFVAGECGACHASNDQRAPGAVAQRGDALCIGCHDDFAGGRARRGKHPAAKSSCTSCHNPHNGRDRALLF